MLKQKVSSWGRYPSVEAEVFSPKTLEDIPASLQKRKIIPRGNGRSYGDSALQTNILSSLHLNRILDFDENKGLVKCESGVLLSDLLDVIVPKGYFFKVTPGTKQITIGGAIASNVHGKNHHVDGAFSECLLEFDILTKDGVLKRCSRDLNADLFSETIGGMGLTGVIVSATFSLRSVETAYIKQKTVILDNLEQLIKSFDDHSKSTYSVAWVDTLAKGNNLGRGVLMLGEHSPLNELESSENRLNYKAKKRLNIPFDFPTWALNKSLARLFNSLKLIKDSQLKEETLVGLDSYFYPLDSLQNWNRIYGKSGFLQYQFVVPLEEGENVLKKVINEIQESNCIAYLAVLKKMGERSAYSSSLSFPEKGYSLALDFKAESKVFSLLDRLDELIIKHKGKVYLTKDARMSSKVFQKMYSFDKNQDQFSSLQIERLLKS